MSKSLEQACAVLEKYPDLYKNTNENLLEFIYTKIIKKNDCVIDIGAHKGLHTQKFLALTNGGLVLAFEPIPHLYKALENQFSNFKNLKLINNALSDQNGETDFYIYENSLAESSLSRREDRMSNKGNCQIIKTKIEQLDNYISFFDTLKFIKIDAESAEINILFGAQKIISKFRPIITIEHGTTSYLGYTKSDLWNYLQKHNYIITDIWGNKFISYHTFENYNITWDFILIPEEKYNEVKIQIFY